MLPTRFISNSPTHSASTSKHLNRNSPCIIDIDKSVIEQHLEGEIKIYLKVNGPELNLYLVFEQATAHLKPGYKTLNHILDLFSNYGK